MLHSKRDGFYETLGELHGKTPKGDFKLICQDNVTISCSIHFDLPAFFGPLASRVWSVVMPFSAKC